MRFFLPSWNGDFRLEGDGEGASVLKVTDPTPHERKLLAEFLRIAARKGWITDGTPVPEPGHPYRGARREIPIGAPIAKASTIMVSLARPKDRTLTAVSFSDGRMQIVEGAGSKALAQIEEATAEAAAQEKKEKDPEKKAEAVSVRRPTPSCPNCLPGAVEPASEVLLSFLTDEQHEDWARRRAIVVVGELTGHRYLIAHRKTRLAARMGRICYDLDDGFILHFHDWAVPPEEEVLAAKLVLEHREPWLRNEATCLGVGARIVDPGGSEEYGKHPRSDEALMADTLYGTLPRVWPVGGIECFKNPFGGLMDGVESAQLASGFGQALLMQMSPEARAVALDRSTVTAAGETVAEWRSRQPRLESFRIPEADIPAEFAAQQPSA